MGEQTTQETLDLVKGILGGAPNEEIAKSISVATGLTAYDLQAPAKNLYPVLTPLRNKIARVGGGTGPATNWKQITAITGSGFDAMPWVPEGQRSGRMSYTSAPKAASYVTIGEEDQLSFEANNAAKGFEDVRSTMTMRLLQKAMIKEESAILGGNGSLTLATPGVITTASSGTLATLPTLTYDVTVVALTMEGYLQSSVANGVATAKTITGADGQQYTLNGGSSMKSATVTQAVTLGAPLSCSVPSINGAVAYAWYIGASGAGKLEYITTINSLNVTVPLLGTGQAISAIAADHSANPGLAFDGLMTAAFTPANSAYVKYLATGVAGTGTVLTASGTGTVVEIDDMLQSMWDQFQLGVTVLYVNSQQLRDITKKCLLNSSTSLLQYNHPGGLEGKPYILAAGGVIAAYFNPFTPDGGKMIPVKIHPKCPNGTIFGYCEDLPVQYQNNNVANVCEIKTRQDYYQIDWPLKTRSYETGVYSEQVLAIYAPFAMGIICNIAKG